MRWNERVETKKFNEEDVSEYVYDAQRIDLIIPEKVAISDYLEKIKADLLTKIQGRKISAQAPLTTAKRFDELIAEAKSMTVLEKPIEPITEKES